MSKSSDFPMIKGAKTTVAGALGIDYGSRNAADYVEVLNRVAAAVGAVPNMGIYADITAITAANILKATAKYHCLDISTHKVETPRKSKTNHRNIKSVKQADLDLFAGTDTVEGILDGTIENHPCPPKVDCDECDGSGKCNGCQSTGKVRCYDCGGDGDCRHCHAEGWVECHSCHGSGDCHTCGGTGWSNTPCPDCQGSGKVADASSGRKTKCSTCDGHGTLPCDACSRSGKCHTCHGKGDLRCSHCEGNGKCHTCKGKGTVGCNACGGNGKCTECNGSGKVKCNRCDGSGWYQTYTTFTAKQLKSQTEWVSNADYKKASLKAQGRTVYSGRLMKWQKEDVLEYNHTGRLRADATSACGGDSRAVEAFLADYEAMLKKCRGIRYSTEVEAEMVPAVRIDFVLERVPHSMVVMGMNGVVVHDSLPRRIAQYRVGLFKRIGMSFTRKARHKEYIRLAAYIMQLDGRRPEESRLLAAFVRSLGYGNAKTKRKMAELERFNASMDYATLRGEVRHLLSSKRVLTFAWHCMERDGHVSEAEKTLWNQLAAEFKLSDQEKETLMRNAKRFSLLSDDQLVEEYLRK